MRIGGLANPSEEGKPPAVGSTYFMIIPKYNHSLNIAMLILRRMNFEFYVNIKKLAKP